MFKPLGLFATSQCPDPLCRRPRCLFNHGETSKAVSARQKPLPLPDKRISSSVSLPSPAKRKAEAASPAKHEVVVREPAAKRPKEFSLSTKPSPVVAPSPSLPTPRPPHAIRSRPPDFASISDNRPPSIPTTLKNSPQPWVDRQKGLQTLYTQLTKLYSTILPLPSGLASKTALEQEAEISKGSTILKTYKSAIHHAAVSISRRPKPDSAAHTSVGTLKESRAAHDAETKRQAGRLTRDRVECYCLPVSEFSIWRYPDPTDPALISGGGKDPSGEGSTQNCIRCKVPFLVSAIDLEGRFGECKFHYGKTAPERVEGRRKWIYSCCDRERGEAGCEDGVHVFTDGEVDTALARRVGFRTVEQVRGTEAKDGVDVVGMDCEMICTSVGANMKVFNLSDLDTTAGSSLARATIVDEDGSVLLDELVRQTVPILYVDLLLI